MQRRQVGALVRENHGPEETGQVLCHRVCISVLCSFRTGGCTSQGPFDYLEKMVQIWRWAIGAEIFLSLLLSVYLRINLIIPTDRLLLYSYFQ